MARSGFSGAMLGCPPLLSASYNPGKQRALFYQRLARHLAYRAQRMVGRHKIHQAVQHEGTFGEGVGSAHGLTGLVPVGKRLLVLIN